MNQPFDDPTMGTPPGMPPNSFGGPMPNMHNGPMGPGPMVTGPMGPSPGQGPPPNSFNGPGPQPGMGPGPPGPPFTQGPGPGMMPHGPRPGMHMGGPGPGPGVGPHGTGKVYPPNQPMVFNPSNPNAPPIYPCGICHKEVHDNDHAILCESGCNFWFHRVCTGLTEPAYLMLTKEIYAEWVCDKCLNTKNIPVVKVKP